MKIIIELAETESQEDIEDMAVYVASVKQRAEQRIWQGLPGMILEHGNGQICVKDIRIVLDTEPDKA